MGDWNRPRHLVLAVSSKIKVMCHSCIFIVFLIQCILSHLQHNIIECMRGVYVLIKHSSYVRSSSFGWSAGGCLLPGKLSLHSDKHISCTNNQAACEAGKCPKSAGEAILKRDFPANPGDLATMS